MDSTPATEVDTRSAVMKQAARLFAERGYDAVSVREIVESAGVTKPALYYHFGSKEGVARKLVEEFFHKADATRAEVFESTTGLRELIETHTREMLRLAVEFRNTLAFGFSLWFGRSSLKELVQKADEHDCQIAELWQEEFQARGMGARAGEVAIKAYSSLLKQELMRVAQCPDWQGCADSLADEMATLVLQGARGFEEGTQA